MHTRRVLREKSTHVLKKVHLKIAIFDLLAIRDNKKILVSKVKHEETK